MKKEDNGRSNDTQNKQTRLVRDNALYSPQTQTKKKKTINNSKNKIVQFK